jgi:hypothetical protein
MTTAFGGPDDDDDGEAVDDDHGIIRSDNLDVFDVAAAINRLDQITQQQKRSSSTLAQQWTNTTHQTSCGR